MEHTTQLLIMLFWIWICFVHAALKGIKRAGSYSGRLRQAHTRIGSTSQAKKIQGDAPIRRTAVSRAQVLNEGFQISLNDWERKACVQGDGTGNWDSSDEENAAIRYEDVPSTNVIPGRLRTGRNIAPKDYRLIFPELRKEFESSHDEEVQNADADSRSYIDSMVE